MQKHGDMEREGIFNSETFDVAGEVRWKIFSEDKASSFENQWKMKKKKASAFRLDKHSFKITM